MAKKKNPLHVRNARGTKITPEARAVLDAAYRKAGDAGFTVLGSLTARTPGLMTFWATAYRSLWEAEGHPGLPPFGVIRVIIRNDGGVNITVMGTGDGDRIFIDSGDIRFEG